MWGHFILSKSMQKIRSRTERSYRKRYDALLGAMDFVPEAKAVRQEYFQALQ